MKAIIKLVDPVETIELNLDAWARLQFERNSRSHGIPAMPTGEAAKQFPETFMCICSYYALKRRGLINGATYDEFELRWDGLLDVDKDEPEEITNPTSPAP